MCGIVGVLNLNGEAVEVRRSMAMTDVIAHRGPDGEGSFSDHNFWCGHRRLAILDLSPAADQPMRSNDDQWVVVFNGCIYNYRDLRKELEIKGSQFVSTGDTEVVVEGLARYGPEYVKRLNGMFAIAAWNRRERALYLSRDRFGVKPLYYWFNGKSLVFASEIKAIAKHPDFRTEVDLNALNEYFTFQNLFTYRTLWKGVNSLPPANTIRISKDTTEIVHRSWWDYDFTKPDNTITFEDAAEETTRLLRQAVQRQMVSDVPVGSYLSGGMDSGSISAIANACSPHLSTFTCGFDLSAVTGVEANYDERRDAEILASFLQTEHYEQVLSATDLRRSLPKVVYHLEDLRVGMSYPNYYIARLASKFVKVCLQGTGGDELYGGYPWRYYRVFRSLDQNEFFEQYYGFWQRLVPDPEKASLFNASTRKGIELSEPRQIFERVFRFNPALSYETPEDHINNSLYFEIKTFLPGLLLVGDKLAMANGLEERFPFLDNDLVELAQKIPIKHKLGNFERLVKLDENTFGNKRKAYQEFDDGKNVLRRAMTDIIPRAVIQRKKQGFSAPDESWYRGENAEYIKELLLDKQTVSSEFINPEYVGKIVEEHVHKQKNHRLLIWSFMCFEWWCRLFLSKDLDKTSA